jgi:hypothetical protein
MIAGSYGKAARIFDGSARSSLLSLVLQNPQQLFHGLVVAEI